MPPHNLICAAALAGLTALSVGAASANSNFGDQVYEDTFGNLIVHSPAGYKQIVVGKGYLAADLKADSAEASDDRRFSRGGGFTRETYEREINHYAECPRYGVLLRGRSFMYGLPDGVTPVLVGPCRN